MNEDFALDDRDPGGPPTPVSEPALSPYEPIEHLLNIGRWELALDRIAQHLASDPEDAFLHSMAARAHLGAGRTARAEEAARTCIRCAPDFALGHGLLAHIQTLQGRHSEAEQSFLAALRIDPGEPYLLREYGRLMLRTGHVEKAEKLVRAALEVDAEDAESHGLLGLILSSRRESVAALRHAGKGVSLEPDDESAHAYMGWVCLEGGRPFQARRHFRAAVRADPADEGAREGFVAADRATRVTYLPLYYWGLLARRVPGGPIGVWIGAIALFQVLRVAGLPGWLLGPAALAYVCFALYTWVAEPITNAWIRVRPPRLD